MNKRRRAQTSRLPASLCEHCGYLLDAATSVHHRRPEPGDLTICASCTGVLIFRDDLRPTKLTEAEREALHREHPDVVRQLGQYRIAAALGNVLHPRPQKKPDA